MHASLVPTANDLASLVAYVLGNPYLFISSSTVMTTGLVLGAVAVSMVPRTAPVMRTVAPPLAMLLLYFGVGSLVLATEILVRFHDTIPDATERRAKPHPSSTGMRMSSRTSASPFAFASASWPFSAATTSWPSAARMSEMTATIDGSSSTTRMRLRPCLRGGARRGTYCPCRLDYPPRCGPHVAPRCPYK